MTTKTKNDMDKTKVGKWFDENGGCLFAVVFMALVVILLKMCIPHKYYVVKETGYFHSTNNEDSCRFIKQAKERDYTIKPFDNINDARIKQYKMCKECFPEEKQRQYAEAIYKQKLSFLYADDLWQWTILTPGCDADYSKMFVYVDTANVLHISGSCSGDKNLEYRHRIDELPQITSLCEICVDREYCDFLYKIIYENTFDTNLIREEYDDY